MSHELDMSNNRANMAYVAGSATPWHGLGSTVPLDASIRDWQVAGGLNFKVVKGGLLFKDEAGNVHEAGAALNRAVLYRDDTLAPLSVMSKNRYTIHQPEDILQSIGDVSTAMGWPVETVGSLFGGRKIWALLKLPEAFMLPGGDMVEGYLLACTSFDGSTGTEFRFISIRVVCNNTLTMGLREDAKRSTIAYHSSALDLTKVKTELGIGPSVWSNFIEQARQLAAVKLTQSQAVHLLRTVYDDTPVSTKLVSGERITDDQFMQDSPTARRALSYFNGAGIGSNMTSALGTGWGLVNSVTQEVDHFGSNRNARLNSAWFGPGAKRKEAVVNAVLELA